MTLALSLPLYLVCVGSQNLNFKETALKLLDNMIMILNKLESITFSVFKFRYLFLLINLFVYKMTINQSNYSGSADFIIESSSFEIN